jgi:hypothetical protein
VALVIEYHEELEHDLRGRNLDLLDLWRGRLSFRQLDMEIKHLPTGSLFFRTFDPDSAFADSWQTSDYLLALVVDLIGKANFQQWKPLERPAQAAARRRADDARRRALIEKYEAKVAAAKKRLVIDGAVQADDQEPEHDQSGNERHPEPSPLTVPRRPTVVRKKR